MQLLEPKSSCKQPWVRPRSHEHSRSSILLVLLGTPVTHPTTVSLIRESAHQGLEPEGNHWIWRKSNRIQPRWPRSWHWKIYRWNDLLERWSRRRKNSGESQVTMREATVWCLNRRRRRRRLPMRCGVSWCQRGWVALDPPSGGRRWRSFTTNPSAAVFYI